MEQNTGQSRAELASKVLSFASRTVEGDLPPNVVPLKDDFDILVKAGLAYVVGWLRQSMIPFAAGLRSVNLVDEGSGRDLDQRVTPSVRDEFLHCAQLLQCLEVALLQLTHLEAVSEQSFLSLQNLLVHLRDFKGNHIVVPDADHRCANIFSGDKCADGGGD